MNTQDYGIYVNQAGFTRNGMKTAVMAFDAEKFTVTDDKGNTVYTGRTVHYGIDSASGDDVYIADFSELKSEGCYRICAGGMVSAAFEINDRVYNGICRDTLHAFYYLRCGCGLDRKYAGDYAHGPCHTQDAVLWEDNSVSRDVTGGWHDAGDYGRYVTAGAAALAHLLYAYKIFPDKINGIKSGIPSDGKTPDLLAECRVELEWIMKMQSEDGGVYHKLTTKGHAAFVMPEDDKGQLYLLPVSSSATADTAAVCALAAGIFRAFDADFSEKLAACAKKAYEWLKNNPDFLFISPKECTTGGYGERSDRDNRFWAAAEMYSLTGEADYHEDMMMLYNESFPKTALGYSETGGLGAVSYILCGRYKNEDICNEMRKYFADAAEQYAVRSDSCGYGTAMGPEEYGWGSNMTVLVRAMIFILAAELCGKKEYISYAQLQMDYVLGKNPFGISYISGTGEYSVNNLHLRPAVADGIEKCHEGFVSGGPNGRPCDPDAVRIIPKGTPPMKCFADNYGCYSLNEMTIYWNSPAVFVSGYFSSLDKD